MRRLSFIYSLAMLVLAACGAPANPTPAAPIPAPGDVIQWERDPLHVVFRMDIVGGDVPEMIRLSGVPLCTLYGDNRLVFTRQAANGNNEVLFETLSDAVIQGFVSYLTVALRIYTYEAGIAYEVPTEITPVYQAITIHVNGQSHSTDSFGAWPPNYFEDILGLCQSLSQAPRRFEPSGAWLRAERTPENLSYFASLYWDKDATGLNFFDFVDGSTRWVEGALIPILWRNLVENTTYTQVNVDGYGVLVAVQVPGITRDAPAAPAAP